MRKNWDPFQKILLDTDKKFLHLTQTYRLTWNDPYYILNATLTPDEKKTDVTDSPDSCWSAPSPRQGESAADAAVPSTEPELSHPAGDANIQYRSAGPPGY